MQTLRLLTFGYGLLYLALGVIGFIPGLTHLTEHPGQGMILGLFAVNGPHNVLHLIFGGILVWGGLALANVIPATRTMTALFVAILIAGLFPAVAEPLQLNETDIAPHAASALVAAGLWLGAVRATIAEQRALR